MNYQELTDSLIGKPEQEARDIASFNGYSIRITAKDNNHYMITCDFRRDRIDLHLHEGKVTKAQIG